MGPAAEKISRCFDLQERHIADAIVSRQKTRSLLAGLAGVSAPDTGVAKVLLVYARMATTACDWVDGDLSIDLTHDRDETIVEAFTELGGGLRERLFPPMRFFAPLTEFSRAISRVPQMIAPLVHRSSARRIRLCAVEVVRRTTAPPPAVHIASESLFQSPPGADASATPSHPRSERPSLPLPIIGRERPRPAVERVPDDAVHGETTPPTDDLDSGWD